MKQCATRLAVAARAHNGTATIAERDALALVAGNAYRFILRSTCGRRFVGYGLLPISAYQAARDGIRTLGTEGVDYYVAGDSCTRIAA